MKLISVLMFVLLVVSAMTLGCIGSPAPTPTPTPTPTATSTPTPTPAPTVTVAPVTSDIYMPQETTNGRTYPSATVPPSNRTPGSGGLITGELGPQ
ncbi:hypothetical protein MCP_1895 [Methanocella paludicola SANAE]|uniref:Uncharacterized protein n=1 Tax=Methanocella paludicola (strain DSM 17711 / JCM 13418 / NBRC 101707 / SANAE) TaxID=304371 RepID=D1YZU5_METPS|nr:hypothetical protein [Methanocella paludicola]BAI61967.1 hypothetical protein MCP_1895 [Methanocella paludicola SANAE]